ncbi:unnamed protein product [Adineta ricciae]|uniref:Uncharacterized protein n=1 Tax=Adineta ricciae TaxID=249248 RepID=A0A815DVN8_ADIRI|nr:unnamed protein product [Adineta ricciae]CAF1298699.1 unnamed protein product [Adineta ricciae]
MAFSNLFRRYSGSNDAYSVSSTYAEKSSIAETLLDELESQCQNCLNSSLRNTQTLNSSASGGFLSTSSSSLTVMPAKRHSSVDYSWLRPSNNLLQPTNETYHLPDILKMELSALIRNVLPEDCTLIINQFRRHIRAQTKALTPENIIALFRATVADYVDQKSTIRSNMTSNTEISSSSSKNNHKTASAIYSFVRNNRVNPKRQCDDEQHCIAELTEISITSSSNDGTDTSKFRLNRHL